MNRRIAAFFVMGVIIGMMINHMNYSQYRETYYQENENLKVQLYEAKERLARLDDNEENVLKAPHIKKVRIMLSADKDLDPITQLELKKSISELCSELIGKEIESLDPLLVSKIVNDRMVEADDKRFLTRVNYIIIAPETTFIIEINEVSESKNTNAPSSLVSFVF